ncbi:oxidoreductase [Mycena floridula]|nr:oxidoreductase [Mycena floridula]
MTMRVVLITGCSAGGIGFSLQEPFPCEQFAKDGCKVYATSRRLESMSGFQSPNIETLAMDVTNDEDVQRVVSQIAEREGRIDILVNNAGILGIGPIIDQTLEFAKLVFDSNVFSIIRVSKAVIPVMAKRKSGVVVNIGSVVGETPTAWNGLYSASKAATINLSEVLWAECKPFNIQVVVKLSQGSVKSNISNNSAKVFELPPDSLYKAFLPSILRRLNSSQGPNRITSEEFARQVAFKVLSRNPPRYMTLGGNSRMFSLFKWLPRTWVLSYLWSLYCQTE